MPSTKIYEKYHITKNVFMNFASECGFANCLILDENEISSLAFITGCYFSSNGWSVYSTGEVGDYYNVKVFENLEDAFYEIARRYNVEDKFERYVAYLSS